MTPTRRCAIVWPYKEVSFTTLPYRPCLGLTPGALRSAKRAGNY